MAVTGKLFGKNLAQKFTYAFKNHRVFAFFERKRNIYSATRRIITLTEVENGRRGKKEIKLSWNRTVFSAFQRWLRRR